MTTAASGLRELHQLQLEHSSVQERIEAGPRQVRAREALTEKKQAEVDAEMQAVTDLRKAADERSLQLKTNETKIIDLQGKLNTASSNKEYDIIKGQIDADTVANSVLEDEILELFDRVEAAQEQVSSLEAQRDSAEAEHKRVQTEVASVEPGLVEERESLAQAIADAESQLSQDVADQYRRLVNAHGPGAMASVDDGSCNSCSVQLSPQKQVELSLGKIVNCNNCGRLLYLTEETDE